MPNWRIRWCHGPQERGNTAIFTCYIDGAPTREAAIAHLERCRTFAHAKRGPLILDIREAQPDDDRERGYPRGADLHPAPNIRFRPWFR